MKILYIGRFHRPWSTEVYVTQAIRKQGVDVITRPFTPTAPLASYQRRIADNGADVVLFSKPSAPCFRELIRWCRERNILTVTWLWDLYFGYRPQRPIQFGADLVFTTDGGHLKHWEELGVNHRVLRQGIHAPDHKWFERDYRYDVAFVGNGTSYRERRRLVLHLLRKYGKRIIHHTRTRGIELNKALAQAKVIVGDSYPAPNYWSNRIYEITGRGGFLLYPETIGLEEEFTEGIHYVGYPRQSWDQMYETIERYVQNDSEREKIRRAGFDHCGANYTYDIRVRSLLDQIREALDQRQTPTESIDAVGVDSLSRPTALPNNSNGETSS